VFNAAESSRGEPGHDDRKFSEGILRFTVHSISWRAAAGGVRQLEPRRASGAVKDVKAAVETRNSGTRAVRAGISLKLCQKYWGKRHVIDD
jgi:hypothetical protein